MAINTDKYIGDLLANYAPLVALLGSANQIVQGFPKAFETLPLVSFEKAADMQANNMTFDDMPKGHALAYNIDVWVNNISSPWAIINAIFDVMNLNEWFLTAERPLDDLNDEIVRRHMVFTASKLNEQISA